MFSTQRKLNLQKQNQSFAVTQTANRRGATLVVVLALLGLMMIIGFFAYSMAGQQQANSEYFANTERAKARNVADFDRDVLFDWSLEQIIKGAPSDLPHSALSGGRHALVPNMFGTDLHPYSGSGYHFILNANNEPILDNDYDGNDDVFIEPWLNASPAANNGDYKQFDDNFFFTPDGSYTAPDMNSTFLGFRGYGLDANNEPVLVIKPSYHRPEMLRKYDGGVRTKLVRNWMLQGTTITSFRGEPEEYERPTSEFSLRAHQDHKYFISTGSVGDNRFVNAGEDLVNDVDGITTPFPFLDLNDEDETWSEGVWALGVRLNSTDYRLGEWMIRDPFDGFYYKCVSTVSDTQYSTATTEPSPWTVDPGTKEVVDHEITWKQYTQPVYSYDADPDGDGVKEAIWMDLDFPIQETPDGSKYFIPMFAVTIYDADGLLNLNAHGNMNGTVDLSGSTIFGNGEHLSKSNLGLSPSEVNPLWALNATNGDFGSVPDADNAKTDHNTFFNRVADTTTSSTEIANMEWFWANTVKLTFDGMGDVEDEIYGRYGDDGIANIQTVYTAENRFGYPLPGVPATDDNGNFPVGDITGGGGGMLIPGHPLDYRGTGDIYGATGKQLVFANLALSNWLQYENYSYPTEADWDGDPGSGDISTTTTDVALVDPALTDEAFEMEADPAVWGPLGATNTDNQFALSENGPLQMSDSDIELSSTSSRLMQLMPWSLSQNNRAEEIRKNFTTHSTDIRARGATESVKRPWEVDSTTDDFPSDSAAAVMRPELADWLRVQHGELGANFNTRAMMQRVLSLNHVIDEDAGGNLYLRRLTPHPTPTDLGTTTTHRTYTVVANPYPAGGNFGGDSNLQEFWARVDRQRMAYDLYVLLYMLGNSADSDPFAADPYSASEKEEMAQFAINTVNQLDRDNIMDLFEYDDNIADGSWGVDDNPYDTASGLLLYGVEAQELVINEVNVLSAPLVKDDGTGSGTVVNLKATEWDDRYDWSFSYIELTNILPYDFSFDNDGDGAPTGDGAWRIEIESGSGASLSRRYLFPRDMIHSDPYRDGVLANDPVETTRGYIGPGEHFVISGADVVDTDSIGGTPAVLHSNARVAFDYDGITDPVNFYDETTWYLAPDMQSIDPPVDANDTVNGYMHLDTVYHNDGSRMILVDPGAPLVAVTDLVPGDVDVSEDITIRLSRRVNPNRQVPIESLDQTDVSVANEYDADNPWVVVDETVVGVASGSKEMDLNGLVGHNFALSDATVHYPTSITNAVPGVDIQEFIYDASNATSQERVEPLNRNDIFDHVFNGGTDPTFDGVNAVATIRRNTIGQDNSKATTDLTSGYETWQPHFDRDFSSPIELLSIPLYGPEVLTDGIGGGTPEGLHMDGTNTFGNEVFGGASNRWYRLLGYVEVPRYDSDVDDPAAFKANMINTSNYRLPGKINWNTIRTPEVLAALMDDVRLYTQDLTPTDGDNEYLPDANMEATRDWWVQFIKARDQVFDSSGTLIDNGPAGPSVEDGRDPITGMYLPGMPGSRPFRSLDFVDDGNNSIEHTMLRELPLDNGRQLFEVGNSTDDLDFPAKQRLLAKMVNNSTNRSNVFFVFVQVDFFEARTQNDGSVRIGGKMDDSPGFRSMFVVDRSLAFETLEAADFPTATPDNRFSLEKDDAGATPFDWRDLVIQRLNIK